MRVLEGWLAEAAISGTGQLFLEVLESIDWIVQIHHHFIGTGAGVRSSVGRGVPKKYGYHPGLEGPGQARGGLVGGAVVGSSVGGAVGGPVGGADGSGLIIIVGFRVGLIRRGGLGLVGGSGRMLLLADWGLGGESVGDCAGAAFVSDACACVVESKSPE